MKVEIEVTSDEIKDAIERKIRVSIAEYSQRYAAEEVIKKLIVDQWTATATEIVKEVFDNRDILKSKVEEILKKKIQSQLQKMLKVS